jgi:cell division protein FtsZ
VRRRRAEQRRRGIAEIINVDGLVNVDFEDVKTVMGEQGKAMMGTATVAGVDRAPRGGTGRGEPAARRRRPVGRARRAGQHHVEPLAALSETREVMNTIKSYAAEDATVIFGAVYDDAMGDALRVTVVATGLGRAAKQQSAPMTLLRTGTDNQPVSAVSHGYAQPQHVSTADYGALDTPAVWRSRAKPRHRTCRRCRKRVSTPTTSRLSCASRPTDGTLRRSRGELPR